MTVTINGTTGIANDGGYTGDGVVFADTTPTNTLVTTTSGNVGIGTSSPSAKLHVYDTSATSYINSRVQGDNVIFNMAVGNSNVGSASFRNLAYLGTQNSYPLAFVTVDTERARIDTSGNLLVGTTTALSKLTVYANDSSSADASFVTLKGGAENIGWINYDNAFGTMVRLTGTKQGGGGTSDEGYFSVRTAVNAVLTGGVYIQGGGTSWTAISDERFKTDLKPIQNASEKVSSLRCVTGRYKTDAEDVSRAFLIAQDVLAVLPEAVSETTHDGENALGLAYTDVIPLLTAAIKEQQAIIDAQQAALTALTARVTALEGA